MQAGSARVRFTRPGPTAGSGVVVRIELRATAPG